MMMNIDSNDHSDINFVDWSMTNGDIINAVAEMNNNYGDLSLSESLISHKKMKNYKICFCTR